MMILIFYSLIIVVYHVLMQHNIQSNWYIEWHFDLLTLWALAYTSEISEAEDLLNGLKLRYAGSSHFLSTFDIMVID